MATIVSGTMSTTDRTPTPESNSIEVIHNPEDDTLTFLADNETKGSLSPTEWITVSTEDLVELTG